MDRRLENTSQEAFYGTVFLLWNHWKSVHHYWNRVPVESAEWQRNTSIMTSDSHPSLLISVLFSRFLVKVWGNVQCFWQRFLWNFFNQWIRVFGWLLWSFYSTAGDVKRYHDSLEPIATEEEIASYAEQLAIKEEEEEILWSRFFGEVDVGTWSVLLFSLLLLSIASIYLNLLPLQVRSGEAIAGCSVTLLPMVLLCCNRNNL